MGMSFGNVIKWLLNGYGKLGRVVEGFMSLLGGGLTQAGQLLGRQGNTADMTNAEDTVYSALAINVWSTIIFSVIGFILSVLTWLGIFGGLEIFGFISCFLSILGMVFTIAISLGINGAIMYFGNQNKTKWYFILVQIWTVITFISLGLNAILGVVNIISLIKSLIGLSVYGIVADVRDILQILVTLGSGGLLLKGLCLCNVTTDSNRQNAFSDAFYTGDQNGFNGQNVAGGLAGLGAVGSQNGVVDGGVGQNNQPMTNGFNQPNIDINKQNEVQVPQQAPQMFACPYCNQPIAQGQNPCPYCNQMVNWGN